MSVAFLATSALGGSLCPSRSEIYPCTCANIHIHRKNIITIVSCYRLENTDALEAIFPFLRTMEIDRFYLYDSFWEANMLGAAGESQKVLPTDWLTLLNIKEVEIVDSALSSCFACQWRINCRNIVTTSFKITNSSSSERICSLCEVGRGNKHPWTGCMSKLKDFHFNYGKLISFGVDFFPMAMRELINLDLSYNQIVKVDSNALKNTPNLQKLDLSHNAIEFFDHMFSNQGIPLEYLDVSDNLIKTVGADLLPSLPLLKTLKARNNGIVDLKLNEWEKIPDRLRVIDLENNPLNCDCNIRWINSTFKVHMELSGTCATPSDYNGSQVRKASRLVMDRCDSSGVMGTRKPSSKRSMERRRRKQSHRE
ncbi:uncharacterized protein CDAR_103521 [Caerostris darwini]|uniref:LRRCT domain-containing protein n=1 Tax=Caerostris darwini TaxID=1538125 RepID=A0AAV4PJK8_9ARAC|nr:uncharacterized protein CDAR_103521 [Caerostris darwini]